MNKNAIRYAMFAGQDVMRRREYMKRARAAVKADDRAFWVRLARATNRNIVVWISLARMA